MLLAHLHLEAEFDDEDTRLLLVYAGTPLGSRSAKELSAWLGQGYVLPLRHRID